MHQLTKSVKKDKTVWPVELVEPAWLVKSEKKGGRLFSETVEGVEVVKSLIRELGN